MPTPSATSRISWPNCSTTAINASQPPGRITVLGEPGAEGGYVLSVVDAGGGLTPAELHEANRRVRRLVSMARIPTRHVGLDVVGRLARRHGLNVRLGTSAGGGVVVRVELPASLFCAPVPAEQVAVTVSAPAPEPEPVVDLVAAEAAEHPGYGVLAWNPDRPVVAAPVGSPTAGSGPLVGRGTDPDDVLPRHDHRKWAAALAHRAADAAPPVRRGDGARCVGVTTTGASAPVGAAAQQSPRKRAGVLAVLHEHLAVDQGAS